LVGAHSRRILFGGKAGLTKVVHLTDKLRRKRDAVIWGAYKSFSTRGEPAKDGKA